MADRPSAAIEGAFGNDPTDILHERLSGVALRRLCKTWARFDCAFYNAVRDAGVAFYNDISPQQADRMAERSGDPAGDSLEHLCIAFRHLDPR